MTMARRLRPALTPLLMDQATFEAHEAKAVPEPSSAGYEPPELLSETERALYELLLTRERGRLEQEFMSGTTVANAARAWRYQNDIG